MRELFCHPSFQQGLPLTYFQVANPDVLLDEYTRLVNDCPSDPEDPGGEIDLYRLIHLLITEAKWTGLDWPLSY